MPGRVMTDGGTRSETIENSKWDAENENVAVGNFAIPKHTLAGHCAIAACFSAHCLHIAVSETAMFDLGMAGVAGREREPAKRIGTNITATAMIVRTFLSLRQFMDAA